MRRWSWSICGEQRERESQWRDHAGRTGKTDFAKAVVDGLLGVDGREERIEIGGVAAELAAYFCREFELVSELRSDVL